MTTPARKTTRKAPAKRTSGATIPASAPAPQDHKSPAQREAENVDTVTVEWEGLTFEIPNDPDSWDFWTVLEPLSANNIPQGLLGLLGPEQSFRLRAAKPRLTGPDARALFDEINRVLGMGNTGN